MPSLSNESTFSQLTVIFFFSLMVILSNKDGKTVLEIRAAMMDICKTASKKLSAWFRKISSLDRLIENQKQLGTCMIVAKKNWL